MLRLPQGVPCTTSRGGPALPRALGRSQPQSGLGQRSRASSGDQQAQAQAEVPGGRSGSSQSSRLGHPPRPARPGPERRPAPRCRFRGIAGPGSLPPRLGSVRPWQAASAAAQPQRSAQHRVAGLSGWHRGIGPSRGRGAPSARRRMWNAPAHRGTKRRGSGRGDA